MLKSLYNLNILNMKMQKYLAFLSYNGKSFSGSQMQKLKDINIPTVQENLKVKKI